MKRIAFSLLLVAVVASCVKQPDGEVIKTIDNLVIPAGTDWKTASDISVSIGVASGQSAGTHKIFIYKSSNMTSEDLIATGAASIGSPYVNTLTVADVVTSLYIKDIQPSGNVAVTVLPVSGTSINAVLSPAGGVASSTAGAPMITPNASFTSPDIAVPSNFDVTISSDQAFDVTGFNTGESSAYGNPYKSYYIPTGVTVTKKINVPNSLAHAVIFVKGTINLSKNDIALNKASLVVLPGGVVTVDGISNGGDYSTYPAAVVIKSGGTFTTTADANFSNNATVVNKGTINAVNARTDLNFNSGSKFYNEGTVNVTESNSILQVTNSSQLYNSSAINATRVDLTVSATYLNDSGSTTTVGTWYQSNGTVLNNYGQISASVQFGGSGGGTVNNFCRIAGVIVDIQSMTINNQSGALINTSNFKVNNSTVNMSGQSMLLITGDITSIYGMTMQSSSTLWAVVKCTGNIPDMRWAASSVKGNIEFVHTNLTTGTSANGRDLYASSFSNGATLVSTQTVNIPGTTCNGSLGQITDPGTGGSGEDTEFASYFPSQTGWASYAFEDYWPSKGDYDLNDIVIGFRVTFISNSSNKITELRYNYKVLAVGAVNNISAAVQLDNVLASNVQSVTGQSAGVGVPFVITSNGTESGVTKAVIPFFNNIKNILGFTTSFFNTDPADGSYVPPVEKQVVIKFVSPVDATSLSMSSFNFFIVVNNRGKEIHLPGFQPTSLFNNSYALSGNLSSTDKFIHADGMMWGLMIPEIFKYPSEKTSIVNGYNNFASWATSGCTTNVDWYQDKSGNRNVEKLY